MIKRILAFTPWIIGVCIICILLFFVDFAELSESVAQIGGIGLICWVVLTVVVRLLHAEITVLPLVAFKAHLRRVDAFWIGWVRTFANQVLPLAGLVTYAKAIRDHAGVSWSEVTALATPQFFISALALSLLGLLVTSATLGFDDFGLVLIGVYTMIMIGSLVLVFRTAVVMRVCPKAVRVRLSSSVIAFEKVSSKPRVIFLLIVCHCCVILIRIARLWLLFALVGQPLEWQTVLLLGVIAESTLIIQLTPGGLGLREGAVLGGAMLVGVDAGMAANVAIIDRLLIIALTVLFVLPSVYFLWRAGPDPALRRKH